MKVNVHQDGSIHSRELDDNLYGFRSFMQACTVTDSDIKHILGNKSGSIKWLYEAVTPVGEKKKASKKRTRPALRPHSTSKAIAEHQPVSGLIRKDLDKLHGILKLILRVGVEFLPKHTPECDSRRHHPGYGDAYCDCKLKEIKQAIREEL